MESLSKMRNTYCMVKHNLFFTSILREKTIQPRDQSANTEELDVIQVAPAIVLGLLGFACSDLSSCPPLPICRLILWKSTNLIYVWSVARKLCHIYV